MNRSIATVTVALVVFLCVSPALSQQAQDPFLRGVELLRNGQYAEAEQSLLQAVQGKPDNQPAWFFLGVARFRQGKLDEALQAFQKALQLAPGRPGPTLYIGQIYEQRGQLKEALAAYQRELAFRRGRDVAEVYCAMGRLYFKLKDFRAAEEALNRALGLESGMVEAMYWLGRVYTEVGRFEDAERQFKRARELLEEWQLAEVRLKRKPVFEETELQLVTQEQEIAEKYHWAQQFAAVLGMWPELNKAMGHMYMKWKRWSDARNAFRKALLRQEFGNEDDPEVHVLVSEAYFLEAREIFEKEGLIYTCIGVLEQAIKSAQKALKLREDYPPAHCMLGRIYACQAATFVSMPERGIHSHTFQDAIVEFQKALAANPKDVEALVGIAEAYLGAGDTAGEAEERQNDYQQALRFARRAVQLAPENDKAHAVLGRCYLALDQLDEALRAGEAALKLNAENVTALNVVGTAYYYKGEFALAAEYFQRAVKANPDVPESYINLGNTYFQMNSWFRARAMYRKALEKIPTATIANTALLRARLHYSIAMTYHMTRNYEQEIDELAKAVALDGTYVDAYLQLADAYEATGKLRAAEQSLRLAIQKSAEPDDAVRAYVRLGRLYERMGKPHEAIAAYAAAVEIDPNNPIATEALKRLQSQASAAAAGQP